MVTRNTLLGDDKVGFEFKDFITQCFDLFLLDLQDLVPICFLCDFDIRL